MKPRRRAALLAAAVAGLACGPQVSEQAQRLAENYVALAHESYERGEYGEAIRIGLQAIETDPTNPDATYVVGFVYGAREEYADAERYLRRTIELEPLYFDAVNLLGVIFINQGRHQEAIDILEPIATDIRYPTPHLAQGNIGQAYTELGQYDRAIEWLLRAVREEPRFCVGFLRLGDALQRRGDDEAAEEALVAAVTVDDEACRKLQPAWRMLGEVRLRAGRRDGAAEAFAKCREIDARSPDGEACAAALGGLGTSPAPGSTAPAPAPPGTPAAPAGP
jgi:tetratricopeptide (TPR) repeat protein